MESPFTLYKRTMVVIFLLLIVTFQFVFVFGRDEQVVLTPIISAVGIAVAFLLTLWKRDREIPIFDLGVFMVFAILVYTVIPPLQFVLAGLQHTALSARQFYLLSPLADDLSLFTWRYVLFLASFCLVYAAARKNYNGKTVSLVEVDKPTVTVVAIMFGAIEVFLLLMKIAFGVDSSVSYEQEAMLAQATSYQQLPLLLKQIYNTVNGMHFIAKVSILTIVFTNWRKPWARAFLAAWFIVLIGGYLFKMGARTELILTFLCGGMLYHRLVRRISASVAATAALSLLAAFLLLGVLRGGASSTMSNMDLVGTAFENRKTIFSIATEFQVLFAGAYDLTKHISDGLITDIPFQFNLYDILLIMPRQILPFEKPDVQEWYLSSSPTPGFFMFNPIAQAAVGFGWFEIALRGALLAAVFAWFHNAYLNRREDFWVSVFYVWMMLQAYNCIRSSSFYFMPLIVFRFLPFVLIVIMLRKLLTIISRPGNALVASE